MKSDARLLLNKKKFGKASGSNRDVWKSHGSLDARKILNLKRGQKSKPPVLGSYMRTKSATALIAMQIKKEISAASKVPNKHVQLSRDGNIIITSKAKPQVTGRKEMIPKSNVATFSTFSRSRFSEESMQHGPSTSMDDLEHTAIEDLLDVESLPQAYVTSNSLQNANLSRKSVMSQVLDKRHTMVADQFAESNNLVNSKVYVSNLHPTVSRQDVMELFGDIGVIRSIEMGMPGTAIIEFFTEADASKACEIYHNRLLDGLPMKCYLQSGSTPQRFALSQRLGNRNDPKFHPTPAALSPTVFNSRSRYNPRNVQFTVKLT